MQSEILKLSEKEREAILNAPFWVTALIAGADGNIDDNELEKAIHLVHTKAYSEKPGVKELYEMIEVRDIELQLNKFIGNLPRALNKRSALLEQNLESLNAILAQLDPHFSNNYVKSLRNFAVHIANASGGIWGMSTISDEERRWLHLTMLQNNF